MAVSEQRCAACREDVEAWKADHVFDLNDCLTLLERHHTLLAAKDAEIAELRNNLMAAAFARDIFMRERDAERFENSELRRQESAALARIEGLTHQRDAARARAKRLEAALVGYLTLKNPNGKAYTRRLQELHADARRALGKDGP